MNRYGDFSTKHSVYLSVEYGETKIVTWVKDGIEGVNNFGSPCMVFEFDEGSGPKKYTISTMSVIKKFADFQIGDRLKIIRGVKGSRPALTIVKADETDPDPAPVTDEDAPF